MFLHPNHACERLLLVLCANVRQERSIPTQPGDRDSAAESHWQGGCATKEQRAAIGAEATKALRLRSSLDAQMLNVDCDSLAPIGDLRSEREHESNSRALAEADADLRRL